MEKFEGLEFWRCYRCPQVVSMWDVQEQLRTHGKVLCPRCSGNTFRVTNLTWWEKLVQIIKHPLVWKWKHVGGINEF